MANISHFTQTVNGVSTTYDIHDANAVDLTSNQTVAGDKEFTGTTTTHNIIPSATDTYNLGSSTNKWKTINGINPGALSLPCDTYTDDHSNNLVYKDYVNGYTFETSYDCLITLRSESYYGDYLIVNDTLNIRNSVNSNYSGVNLFARKGDLISVYCPAASINTGVLLRLFKLKGNE